VILEAVVLGRTHVVEVEGGSGLYTVSVDGVVHEVRLAEATGGLALLQTGGRSHELGIERGRGRYRIVLPGDCLEVELAEPRRGATKARSADGPARIVAPMPGRIVRVATAAGAAVEAGQGLVVIEAMKMENELKAPRAGSVLELLVREGQAVEAGAPLLVVG
jgi:acetyl/propionyl-CoA carboxylase alpha subunit